MWRHSRQVAVLALVLATLLFISSNAAGEGSADVPVGYVVRIAAASRQERASVVGHGFAIDGVTDDSVTVFATREELARLERSGLPILEIQPLQFPIDDDDYHTYDEMIAELQQAAVDHGGILELSIVGQSIENRDVLAVKVSDHVGLDEPEPEVLIFALTHAREHLTTEQALDLVAYLTDSYGIAGDVTNLVNEREIWILPNVNPDGNAYDWLGGGFYRNWRKNRRDNGDGSWGVDLNRNYAYRWGFDDVGSSPYPSSATYRGAAPFSELETQVIRDFVLEHSDLVSSISLHTYGELILWPFGYTMLNLPTEMDPSDQAAFETMGQAMAELNGYTAQQASLLYPTNGGSDDWLYGEQSIFAFTFELYPVTAHPGFYPDDSVIRFETVRNRSAIAYLIGVSDNPRKVIGDGGDVTDPEVFLTHPDDGVQLSGTVTLRADASDDVGVTLVEFLLDEQTIAVDIAEPYEMEWDSSAAPGVHTLMAQAYDHGQNVAQSRLITIRVGTMGPTETPTPTTSPTATAWPSPTPTATPTPTAEPILAADTYLPLILVGGE